MLAALGLLGRLRDLHPEVAKGVDALVGGLTGNPGVLEELLGILNEIAATKDMSVEELISSGTLGRVILEKATTGVVAKEVRVDQYAAMKCPHCHEYIYDKEVTNVRTNS